MDSQTAHRSIIVISGTQSDALTLAKKLAIKLDVLHLSDQKKANQYLGQEFDAVIFETHLGLDANALGAITGTIRGAGYLLLLKPEGNAQQLFLKRFYHVLAKFEAVTYIDSKCQQTQVLAPPPTKNHAHTFASDDQQLAVNAVIKVVQGHRRRPLVITADRGRGKSAALGIAAAELYKKGVSNIIVCAPSKKTAAKIFQHAEALCADIDLKFYAPDQLQQQQPKADLVLIDEAAAIPIPLLIHFVKRYSRIVFASTQHGYEGSGRGFTLRFQNLLQSLAPDWSHLCLEAPIRWRMDDHLEQFIYKALLLNAEPEPQSTVNNFSLADSDLKQISQAQLLKNEPLLQQIFGLLVSAHYQTKPSDLKQLLDDEAVSVFIMQAKSAVVAVALVNREGEIDAQLCFDIFAGKRRLQGNLVAQSLAANIGIATGPQLKGERISRIAVHPALQRRGLATSLLKFIYSQSNADYLSTSFGATKGLLQFWQQANFNAVHLGVKRDASSASHSVIMLKAKTEQGDKLLADATSYFAKSFWHLLSDTFCTLESDIIMPLLTPQFMSPAKTISPQENQILKAFAFQQRAYENSFYPIWKCVRNQLANAKLESHQQKLLIIKVLQKSTWPELKALMPETIKGKKDGLHLLREAVSMLLKAPN